MKEILPPEKRWNETLNLTESISTEANTYSLPAFFASYENIEEQTLNMNLCEYSYLNTGTLYKGINCSLILDGVMDLNYPETYIRYIATVNTYSGVGLSQLGDQIRQAATYPVYMELCYIRRTLNNIFVYLQDEFSKLLLPYIAYESGKILSLAYNTIYLYPLFIFLVLLELKKIRDRCQSVLKSFRVLPKKYILDIKVTKFIKSEDILDKMEIMTL